uniref:HET domain-containing protein n=1 Tax=Haemonchus contortus TaxID=6289 RepID=A0A7I5EEB5_HAECO
MNSLSARLPEFVYDPENGCTFEACYNHSKDDISKDGAALDEAAKAQAIVFKLEAITYTRFTSRIIPRRACETALSYRSTAEETFWTQYVCFLEPHHIAEDIAQR